RFTKLAVQKRLIGQRARPYIEKPAEGPSRVLKGFFTREQVETVATRLPAPLADLVLFLFFSAWRIVEARRLELKHVLPSNRPSGSRPSYTKTSGRRRSPSRVTWEPSWSAGSLPAISPAPTSSIETGGVSATSGSYGRRRATRSASRVASSTT